MSVSAISKRILDLVQQFGLTYSQLSEKTGLSKSALQRYATGTTEGIPMDKLELIASALNVDPAYLMGWTLDAKPGVRINVYRCVHAGIPLEAQEDIVDWEDIPREWTTGGREYFGVRVKGDCMAPKYLHGDTVIVRRQQDCESGTDAIIYINGYDAELKRLIKEDTGIILQPINSAYLPKKYYYNDPDTPITVVGVVVEIRRRV